MKKLFIVAGIWISLFAGSALISHLVRGNATSTREAVANALPDNARDKLNSFPRRTQGELVELDNEKAVEAYPEFLSSFQGSLMSNAEPSAKRLRDCKNKFMTRSSRVREFVEFSFVAREEVDADSGIRRSQIYDVLIERSSIELSEVEADCLRSALEGMVVGSSTSPVGRLATAMCFGHGL